VRIEPLPGQPPPTTGQEAEGRPDTGGGTDTGGTDTGGTGTGGGTDTGRDRPVVIIRGIVVSPPPRWRDRPW
jgi:hypothetical protein